MAALAVSLGMAAVAPARADTLADALVSAYNTSGLLEQNRALLRAADENVAQAMSGLRPIISWTGDITRSFATSASASTFGVARDTAGTSTSLGISAQLVVYDFGQSSIPIEIAKESVLSTRYSLIGVEQSVLLRAVNAYMEVIRAQEFLQLRQNNVRLIQQELRAAQDRFEVGEVTRTDVSLAEARLAAARSGLAVAQGDLTQAQQEFIAAVGRAPGTLNYPGAAPRLPGSVNAAVSLALRNHPDMLAAQKDVTVAELNVAAADAALKPTVSVTARYGVTENFNSSAFNRGGSVGLGVSGPIYAGGRLSSLQRQAMQRRDAARANLHVVSASVRQNVGNAYASVQVARAGRGAGDEQVRAARVAFQGVREETTLGARTTLDVLNAEQELLDAQANAISAQVDEFVAAYSVLAAMGQLTAQDLRLAVQIYDPAAYYNMVKTGPAGLSSQGQKLDRVLRSLGKD